MNKTLLCLFVIFINMVSNCHSTYIIGFCGLADSGKSTTAKAIAKRLDAEYLGWDDFDETAIQPRSIEQVVKVFSSSDPFSQFSNNDFADALSKLRNGESIKKPDGTIIEPSYIIIVEAPLGRLNDATAKYIDKIFLINTKPETAFKRQIARDAGLSTRMSN